MRIISICPSNTELLAYLNMLDHLIAIDNCSDWPSSIAHLPKVGPDLHINMEKVAELKPDLVLASLSVPGMERNVEELQKRNIPHLVFAPNSLEDIANDLLRLGEALGQQAKAIEVVHRYRSFIEQYRQLADSVIQPARLYWEWWPKPIFTPGNANWLSEISRLAGGSNIFADMPQANVQTDWNEVVKRNPSHICLVWVGVQTKKMNKEAVKKRVGAENVDAVCAERIYILEESLYCRPSPRLLVGLKKLSALLHPSVFPVDDGQDPLLAK
ncbi:cobalamin-binding protein [Parageobacillus sp. VR-IP]|uniref:cobalamin-binding protein n=1 Tax=Parageobacillus sp. VR-IP TaxID=2742205 RepID=UPI0015819FE1|nr:cobalamin-binding protein [Parageobacillus sp. VR-IP]NUK29584.1 cobalamin-binding protein [Parageobacillus sp. VR-IP]